MTQSEKIWILIGIASLAGSIGIVVGLREIIYRVNSIPVHNRLRRTHNDIELNYIEPVHPGHAYQPIDLVNPNYMNYETYNWGDRVPTYYSGQHAPSYFSGGNPPSFHTLDRFYINSFLENENIINLYFIWIIFICFLIIFLKMKSIYILSILIPFSLFEIDFRDSFEWKFDSYRVKPEISYLKLLSLTEDIKKLLDSLKDDVNYSMGLSFISSYKEWQDNKKRLNPIIIDNPIIINKESDPILITQFIMNRLNENCLFYSNWLFKDSSINSMDPVILTVTVAIKVEI